jgi:glucose-1-phosphate adenylyltransferase
VVLAGDHVYKMDYSLMLADHVRSGAGCTVGCIEVPRNEASAFGVMAVDDHRKIIEFVEKPDNPPPMPGNDAVSLASMGIYIFNAQYLYDLLDADIANPGSSHDFGKDVIPHVVAEGRAIAHPFSMSCVSSTPDASPYWRDVGTIDAFWEANLDLASVTPELDIYDTNWPIWTSQRQLPPAKFVQDADGKHGQAINTMVSGGCIVSGSVVSNSVLFSSVRIHSYCTIDQAVLLPEITIGRGCRLSKVVVDRGCEIPDGLVIGEDAELDAARFERSENGVVLVTRDMLLRLPK